MKLDLYEPRAEDDTAEAAHDPDKTYCISCEDEVDDNDFEAVERSKGWIHVWCINDRSFK